MYLLLKMKVTQEFIFRSCKKAILKAICSILLIFSIHYLQAQNIPVDFEENGYGADWSWRTFENGSNPKLEITSNPDSTYFNTSDSVAMFVALANGAPFAGIETKHGEDIGTFTINQQNAIIRILVWKSVISDVGIKLVRADNWSLGEIKVSNTKINEWEQLEFDFSDHIGLTYDQLVIFPDFRERNVDEIIYFDDVFGALNEASSTSSSIEVSFNVFPNPASSILNIEFDHFYDIHAIQILDLKGRKIRSVDPSFLTKDQKQIKVGDLQQGSYLLQVIQGDKIRAVPFSVLR